MNIKELLVQYIKEKPVALVGAGISLNSGVPTVNLLKTAILKEMNILKDKAIKIFLKLNKNLLSLKIAYENFSEIYLELHDLKKAKYYENRIKSL